MRQLIGDLNRLYRTHPALHERDLHADGFQWIDCDNQADSTLAYLRYGTQPEQHLMVCCNFTPIVRHACRFGVPASAPYVEIFNSDSRHYGGSGIGNSGPIRPRSIAAHAHAQSLELNLPPLGVCILTPLDSYQVDRAVGN
jgi:1,4-alpha-glucan branching enzyme